MLRVLFFLTIWYHCHKSHQNFCQNAKARIYKGQLKALLSSALRIPWNCLKWISRGFFWYIARYRDRPRFSRKLRFNFTNKLTKESFWWPSLWNQNSLNLPNQIKNWNWISNQHEIYYLWMYFGFIPWESLFKGHGHCAIALIINQSTK